MARRTLPRAALALAVVASVTACAPPSPFTEGWARPRWPRADPSPAEIARRDHDRALATAYAPAIFQATRASSRPITWDTPTRVDFDGDLRASNNEESLRSGRYPVEPCVYYAVIETETHIFITYGIYHVIDWSIVPPIVPYTWHENDMENLQVVVRKPAAADDRPAIVLLITQAHIGTATYAALGGGIRSGSHALSARPLRLVGAAGAGAGDHAAVYVEWGGHGVHGVEDQLDAFASRDPLTLREGTLYFPSAAPQPHDPGGRAPRAAYSLLSIYDTFWAPYLDGTGLGDGALMDGSFSYFGPGVAWGHLPRHLDSDRLSGPCKDDAGILPFAFGYALTDIDLGSIFFNPAETFAETLAIEGAWSVRYVRHPYRAPPEPARAPGRRQ